VHLIGLYYKNKSNFRHAYFEHLLGRAEKTHEKFQSGEGGSKTFEPGELPKAKHNC